MEFAFEDFLLELPKLRAAALERRGDIIEAFSGERMAAEYDASWTRAIAARRARSIARHPDYATEE